MNNTPCCINLLIQSVIATIDNKSPGITFDPLPIDLSFSIDTVQIKMVLNNLLENALKYSKNHQTPIKIIATTNQDELCVSIIDKGKGIAPDVLPYVLEPFYRADKSRSKTTGGYGLGLNLCKTIIETHHGHIEMVSALDQGTTVSFYLPL